MMSVTMFKTALMFVTVWLHQYCESLERTTRCVETDHQSLTVSCPSEDYMIVTRSAFYARLPVTRPRFCDRPVPDNNRRDCVPHAAADRDNVSSHCNSFRSCELYLSRSSIVSSCSNVTGQVYINVDFDCISRKRYGGSYIDFIYAGAHSNTRVSHKMYIFSSLYPRQAVLHSSNKCQIRLPANADVQVQLLDVRSNLTSCAYQLYVYSAVGHQHRAWCATSEPPSSRQYFLLYSTPSRALTVDVVFRQNEPSATGAFWIDLEARMKDGSPAQNMNVLCGSSVQLQPLPFTSSRSTSTTSTSTTTTTTTPHPTTTRSTTTTTPTTTTTTRSTTTTTRPVPTTTITTPRPTTTSSTTTTTPTTTTTSTTTTTPTTTTTTPTTTTITSRPTTTSTTTTTTLTTTTTRRTPRPPTTSTSSTTTPTTTTTTTTQRPTTKSTTTPSTMTTTTTTSTSTSRWTTTLTLAVTSSLPPVPPTTETSSLPSNLVIIVSCAVGGGVFLLCIVLVVAVIVARNRREAKLRRLSKKLPDVIGTWKYENGGGNPGGAGPDTELHDTIQPTTTLEVADPTYLQPAETVLEETTITPTSVSPQVHETPRRTTILFDPGSMERRNRNGQVRFVAPEDGTIQYPDRGATFFDDRHDWRTRALMNAKDRHPNALGGRGSRPRRSSPPPRRQRDKPPPQSLTSPRVTALQATDTEAQQNPLYGASMNLFLY